MNVKFITLGCKVNQAESESLAAYAGRADAPDSEIAEMTNICVINTCAVTGKAAMQSRQAIRKAIKNHPEATIIVTGCYAQTEPESIAGIAGVDYIIGQSNKHLIYEIADSGPAKIAGSPVVINKSIEKKQPFSPMPAPAFGMRTRPFLKIQDGCDSFCTYCIVPYSRGRSRSLPMAHVLAELDTLVCKGAKEIVLTGIHLGKWGTDLPGNHDLVSLLENIQGHPDLKRIRLSSLEPTEITGPLLDIIAASPKICRHFHVPLQSGDPDILRQMNRHYSPEDFGKTIIELNRRFGNAAIGADVMVGFPGESVHAFENTYRLIESLPISYLHVFPFSARPPAPAAKYPNPVPAGEIKKRGIALAKLGRFKKAEFFKKMIGQVTDVIVEKKSSRAGFWFKGLSSNYIPVYIQTSSNLEANCIVDCLVTDSDQDMSVSAVICRPDGNQTPSPLTSINGCHMNLNLKPDIDTFSISDLADELDISTRTIRFYEEKGLISPRRTKGNHRIYTKRDRARLKLILRGKRLGYSLDEIAEMIGMADFDMDEEQQLIKTLQYGKMKLKEINSRMEELQILKQELLTVQEKILKRFEDLKNTPLKPKNS